MKYWLAALFALSTVVSGHDFIAIDTKTKEMLAVSGEQVKWVYKCPQKPQDVMKLENGHLLLCMTRKVVELDKERKIIWSFEAKGEMHSAQRLKNGNTLIGHTSAGKMLEVNSEGKVVRSLPMQFKTKNRHRISRRVRMAADGLIYVGHHGDGVCKSYDAAGQVKATVAHYRDYCFSATKLTDGNLLLTGNTKMKVVNDAGKTLWEVSTDDFKGQHIATFTSAKMLENGNILVTNWMGHEKKRLGPSLVEISRDKKIVWSYRDKKNKCLIGLELQ